MHSNRSLIAWTCALLFTLPGLCWSQACSYSIPPQLNFGTITGLPTPQIDAVATISVTCPLLSTLNRRVCISLPVGSGGISVTDRRMVNGAFDISYQLYQNAARTTVWGTGAAGAPQLALNFPLLAIGPMTATIYGRVFAGQSALTTGNYQSTLNSIQVREAQYLLVAPACNSIGNIFNLPNPLAIQLQIDPTCTISANPLSFGTVTSLSGHTATTNLTVTCTLGGAYSVALNGGSVAGDVNDREMQQGADTIAYQLYRDAGMSQIWGDMPGSVVTGTGSGSPQNLTVYGRVPPQGPKPVGTYSDTITATVTF